MKIQAHQKTKLKILFGLFVLVGIGWSIVSKSWTGFVAAPAFFGIGLWVMLTQFDVGLVAMLVAGAVLAAYGYCSAGHGGYICFLGGLLLMVLMALISAGSIY